MFTKYVNHHRTRSFLTNSIRHYSDFSHVIIGGGVVGTAIASELQQVPGNNVLLVEKNHALGFETTSRNSEVIHAGLYYPKDSLKSKLCIAGKQKIYQAGNKGDFPVPYKNCGKWVVAQNDSELEYLEKLYQTCKYELDIPVSMVSASTAANKFPLIQAKAGALESPTTGIISAHDLTTYFQNNFEINEGTLSLNTTLKDIQFNQAIPNYTLNLFDNENGEFEIQSDNVINAAGLYAPQISNLLLPSSRQLKSYFAKGNYFSFEPTVPINSSKITNVLIYPCPNPNASSLGTHLTFDLGGQLRFGPDLEWLEIDSADQIDYTPDAKNLPAAFEAIKTYFPSITIDALHPTYSGVRPKIVSSSDNKKTFADFIIREEEYFPGFVNLLGIESPGLTASWAIGEFVRDIYHK
ncbi:FAD dependent oxidoreductase [Scheffersomyces coipomensis]|uniref:FAD dependent oxidoreductase n=1 Tax=Scheffersomyces coipomensis TaxID=1788519 RepID=UPI00315D5B0F